MKITLVFLAIIALSSPAPQPRKHFHEHFEDFLEVIYEEVGEAMEELLEQYLEFEELWNTLHFMATTNFKDLVYEMEALPEFKAVIDFLEKDNIDITYFLDMFNEALEEAIPKARQVQASGKDLTSFIKDSVALFPKDKLKALFNQKMADDVEFRTAIENLQSDEWDRVWGALWENETFQNEVRILNDNGVDISVLLNELMAVFGQN